MPRYLTPQRFRILAIFYALLVLTVSSWPSLQTPDLGFSAQDKFMHFGQYFVFSLLVVGGWRADQKNFKLILIALFLIAFAGADEFHQGWIPGRDPDPYDWLADSIGVILGGLCMAWLQRKSANARHLNAS